MTEGNGRSGSMKEEDKTALEYAASHEETLVLNSVDKDLICADKVQINSNLPQNTKIEANRSVVINGNVAEGCSISCTTGPIVIKGNVSGSVDRPVTITSKQYLKVESLRHAIVKTEGPMTVMGDVIDSKVNVKETIEIRGSLIRSDATSNSRMTIRICGSEDPGMTKMAVMPAEILKLLQELLKSDTKIEELTKLKGALQNTIELLKKLRTDSGSLPHDKHEQLVTDVARFSDLTGELKTLGEKKRELVQEIVQLLGLKWITVEGRVFPTSVVSIANRSHDIRTIENRLRFSVKNNVIEIDL
jgi:hypothetical protein